MRDQILKEIRRLQGATGQVPGRLVFERETGIAEHHWRGKYWSKWGEAVAEAGFSPNSLNPRLDSDLVLSQVVAACRHFSRLPTAAQMQMYRNVDAAMPNVKTVFGHFGNRQGLVNALVERVAGDESLTDVALMLPSSAGVFEPQRKTSNDGFVYLLKSGDHFKIGRGDDLERRVKQMTVALPQKTDLVHSIRTDDAPGIEAYWHRRFAEKRANGEWFTLTSLDVAAFKKRKFQ